MGIGKIIIGIILIAVGIWILLPIEWGGVFAGWQYLEIVLMGIIPIFLVFLGAILVWIEWEEMRIEKPSRKRR